MVKECECSIKFWRNLSFVICVLVILSLIFGCAPRIIPPIEVPRIEFEMESVEPFRPEEKIEKPDKPNPIYLNIDFAKVENTKQIEYFVFHKKEFPKIIQLSKSFDAQEKVIEFYEDIINLEVGVNNNLKNILNDRNLMTQHYADLYIQQQNLRLQEEYQFEKNKFFDKILLYFQSGVILVLTILSK